MGSSQTTTTSTYYVLLQHCCASASARRGCYTLQAITGRPYYPSAARPAPAKAALAPREIRERRVCLPTTRSDYGLRSPRGVHRRANIAASQLMRLQQKFSSSSSYTFATSAGRGAGASHSFSLSAKEEKRQGRRRRSRRSHRGRRRRGRRCGSRRRGSRCSRRRRRFTCFRPARPRSGGGRRHTALLYVVVRTVPTCKSSALHTPTVLGDLAV